MDTRSRQTPTERVNSGAALGKDVERGRQRVLVFDVRPQIDGGLYPIKRILHEEVRVECDLVSDGHDVVVGVARYRFVPSEESATNGSSSAAPARPAADAAAMAIHEVELTSLGNDRFRASFKPTAIGIWQYTVEGWVDAFATYRRGLEKKVAAGQDVSLDLRVGAKLINEAAARADAVAANIANIAKSASGGVGRAAPADLAREAEAKKDASLLRALAAELDSVKSSPTKTATAKEQASAGVAASKGSAISATSEALPTSATALQARPVLAQELAACMARYRDRSQAASTPWLSVVVDPPKARFSSWYEMFPRSTGDNGRHGTFADAEKLLPYVAEMGFDVLYLPPIHPIGKAFRKGPNNTLEAKAGDPGSPWAIGAEAGGHMAIHPELGTVDDFKRFRDKAKSLGLDIALDIAFQASPDHPYVRAHPEWFVHRPDGSIQYAENPPKKYQDVYPFDFEGEAYSSLWTELRDVFLFWVRQGVTVFRVDNPHTKSLRFWEWCIGEIKARHPETIFLAEAFTRPKLMYALAKGGFTQSYTYFTWRHTKAEFIEYLTELTRGDVAEFYRPNFWPNTPDILPEHLQYGGRPAFVLRLLLAATLSSNFGIYGPPFELMEHVARPQSEEYIDNEKFQLRSWNRDDPKSLRPLITRVNRIRRENRALQQTRSITFHKTDSDHVLAFSKRADEVPGEGTDSTILVVANMDVHQAHGAWLDLDLAALGATATEAFQVHDLISDERYHWQGPRQRVELNPHVIGVHVFRIRRRVRTEQDFEYFL